MSTIMIDECHTVAASSHRRYSGRVPLANHSLAVIRASSTWFCQTACDIGVRALSPAMYSDWPRCQHERPRLPSRWLTLICTKAAQQKLVRHVH